MDYLNPKDQIGLTCFTLLELMVSNLTTINAVTLTQDYVTILITQTPGALTVGVYFGPMRYSRLRKRWSQSWIPWDLSFRYISFHEKRLQTMLWHHNARVNSHQRWKQTRLGVCFHLWCELTSTMNVTEWQASWNACHVLTCCTDFQQAVYV